MAPIDPAEQAMIDALPDKTGRDLDAWLAHLRETGLEKHGAIMGHLKKEHGVTHGYANLITQYARGRAAQLAAGGDDLVAQQYDGAKAHLRPIYEQVLAAVRGFGGDVDVAPKKTYVSLRRSKQFALVQPSTKTRVDVGIKLSDDATTDRLEASGSFNAMVSHRVRVGSVDEVDDELIGWLRQAYEEA